MTMKRRDALKTIGGLAGAASLAKLLPACDGEDGPVGITTYVYLMLENRSYDHAFGSRATEGLPGDGMTSAFKQADSTGTMIAPYIAPSLEAECVLDPPHGWDAAHASFNNGAMDGFLKEHQKDHPGSLEAIQFMTREQMPVSYALADAYTSCDRWF